VLESTGPKTEDWSSFIGKLP